MSRIPVGPSVVAQLVRPGASPPTVRDLELQALLHLPRIAFADGTVDERDASAEIERLRVRRRAELEPLSGLEAPPRSVLDLEELDVAPVDVAVAEPILAHFHYLRSFRPDSRSICALYENRVAALCSVSPLDVSAIAERLPIKSEDEAAVVSRVFAFDWAPRNVVSYLLARAPSELALSARVLVTYLDPNMGFTGASYRASNWRRLGVETGTRYAYLDEDYVTDRRVALLSAEQRRRVEYSRMPLRPLEIYGRSLDRSLDLESCEPFRVERAGLPS
jgi:hypothetical protein